MSIPKYVLPIIVIAQFCCTSLWFAGNGVMNDLVDVFSLPDSALGHLTSSVQFGFISGTLIFALLSIADRFSPSRVFFISALFGALFNLGVILNSNGLVSLLLLRFFTGFFLAGIYPVGMKIASDYFQKGLGKSLGFLVGALVLGTAFPHLLKVLTLDLPWRFVLIVTTVLATLGGLMIFIFIPDGPYRRTGSQIDLTAFMQVFRKREFRSAAFGYFGHMWELYTFWAFVPVILATWLKMNNTVNLNIPLWSFIIIGSGGLACVAGGYLSQRFGTKRVAFLALSLSCLCCLFSPLMFHTHSVFVLLFFLVFWGMVVIADSPLFSTLVAQNADVKIKGTALTIVNCIGFAITIISIQLVTYLSEVLASNSVYMILALGPLLGLLSLGGKKEA